MATTEPTTPGGDDVILQGIVKLGDSLERTSKAMNDRVSAAEAKLAREAEDLRKKQDENIDFMARKIESLEKRTGAAMRFSTEPVDDVLASIPENKRALIPRLRMQMPTSRRYEPNDPMSSEIVQTAAALWFQTAAKLQLRHFDRYHEELLPQLNTIERGLNAVSKVALAEGTSVSGGYLVPTIIASEIQRIALDASVVYGRARRIPMTSQTLQIPNEATGCSVNFVAEAGTMTQGEPVFGANTLTAKKIVGRATVSMELVDDSQVDLFPYIQTIFAEKIGRTLDSEALEGTTNFSGVKALTATLTTGNVTGAAPTYANLVTIMYKAGEESTRTGAAWFMNPQIFGNIVGLTDTNGQPIFQYANVQNSPYPTILGRPVYLSNVLTVALTVGGVSSCGTIFFGDPRTLVFGEHTGMRFDVTDQVNWATGQFDMRLIGRWGFVVGLPAAWCVGLGMKKVGT